MAGGGSVSQHQDTDWEGGQLVRILTSQPGNWNGWIFCTNGDGASGTVYIYSYIHIPPRQCPLSNYDMLLLQPGT